MTPEPIASEATAAAVASAAKKEQRPRVLQEAGDVPEDADAVAVGPELAFAGLSPRPVVRRDLDAGKPELDGVQAHLGLGLEPGRERRKRFHEGTGEGAVAGEDVDEGLAEQALDEPVEQPVAGLVAAAVGGGARRGARACRPPCRAARPRAWQRARAHWQRRMCRRRRRSGRRPPRPARRRGARTLPLPRWRTLRTIAPAAFALAAVSSVESLSKT